MSEPGVTRPGEAAAVEAARLTRAYRAGGAFDVPADAVHQFTREVIAAAYPIIAAAVRAEERERIAQLRCGAEHPTNVTMIPCMLSPGHDGPHWSTSGCAGGAFAWPTEAMRLRAVQAALAAPTHYAIDPRLAREEPTE